MGCVSRGGSFLLKWIKYNNKENPLFVNFDRICDILNDYGVALSLGDGMRPGAIADATDEAQIGELKILGDLVERARAKGTRVFVEGPGHVPINQIVKNMELQKQYCHGAPFYVLGPLVTDLSPGYDHISGAIGGAIAAMNGANFLCYVTPAEHLRLPDINDVREGVIASRIAAHSADMALGIAGTIELDNELSIAKKDLNWSKMISLCFDPDKALDYRNSRPSADETVCSMCGEYCAIRRSREIDI